MSKKAKIENEHFGPGATAAFEAQEGTDSSQAVTLNSIAGTITSSTTNLGTDTSEKLTVTNKHCQADSLVLCMADEGGAGSPVITKVTPKDGSFEVTVRNVDASNACDAAYKVRFIIFKDSVSAA